MITTAHSQIFKNDLKMKDFAILHNTPKGQILVTKEFDIEDYIITTWFQTDKMGLMKMSVSTEDEKKQMKFLKNTKIVNMLKRV